MGRRSGYWVQHKKDLKYTLLFAGLVLMALGSFFDLTWLKSVMACYAMDGECQRTAVVDTMAILFTGSGFYILLAMLGGYPGAFFKRQRIEIALDLSVLFILILFLVACQVRYFNNDEYEHLHNAWLMTEGTIPYFEWSLRHMPLLEWITILFMGITGEHTILVQTMRFFTFLTACGSLWMVYLIVGKLFQSRLSAIAAVALILGNQVWITKSFEIRPDNLMVFFTLASFWCLIKYYEQPHLKHLFPVGGLAILAMLGKQNAAVFYLPFGIIFFYHLFLSEGKRNFKIPLSLLALLLVFLCIPITRDFLVTNIQRHLIPSEHRFTPWAYLRDVLSFNPAIFLLFLFQLFTPLTLADGYGKIKPYLYAIPLTALLFLFIMNRPFKQEMLIMIIFMSMTASGMLVDIMGKLNGKLKYVITAVLLGPVVYYMFSVGFVRTWTEDLNTTKAILRISERNDLVFDSYGKPIFRHHPLEPDYLIYLPKQFNRLNDLKQSGVKYLISDFYTRGLPSETIEWLENNFVRVPNSSNIYVMANQPMVP